MSRFFGYVRVSTAKQGEKGVSLQEQRAAIQLHAERNGLSIGRWFEERETAAKRGRPVFTEMMRLLRRRDADGIIIHKIDRSARNLRDWADLGELIDLGIVVHFANEGLDLRSRGGRLSADIQAVVAADYVRNLREETRKGFYGRLKQGLYPLAAPLGYLNTGGGKAKTIDPARGHHVRHAFQSYATGQLSLDRLATELRAAGLRGRSGGFVGTNRLSEILHNPFYTGLIRIKRTGETFEGVHEPLISFDLFQKVQAKLAGREQVQDTRHWFTYRRRVACALCGKKIIGERQKGHVYYRCHEPSCPMTGIREEIIESAILAELAKVDLPDSERNVLAKALAELHVEATTMTERAAASLQLLVDRATDRLKRLTDAMLDGLIEHDLFTERKASLLGDKRSAEERLQGVSGEGGRILSRVGRYLELASTASLTYGKMTPTEKREFLGFATSNLAAERKRAVVGLSEPFRLLADRPRLLQSALARGVPRTGRKLTKRQKMARTLIRRLASSIQKNPEEDRLPQDTPVAEVGRDALRAPNGRPPQS